MVTSLQVFTALLATSLHYVLQGKAHLTCPDKIKSFAGGVQSGFYYACNGKDSIPTLKRCPEGETYWPYGSKCHKQNVAGEPRNVASDPLNSLSRSADLKTYTVPILGRTVYLGDFFNARSNDILTAYSLWKPKTVRENKIRRRTGSTRVSFFSAASTMDRFTHMDASDDLKMEFLSGLVTVEGSAELLKDSLKSENAIAVIMKYKATTHSESIPVMTPADHADLCGLKTHTHVVSTITYGIASNFVFEKTVKDVERKGEVTRRLEEAVKLIPHFKVHKEKELNLSVSVREMVKDVDVKLFSDFMDPEEPTSYKESVITYHNLPNHLGNPPEYTGAVPIKMILSPVQMFCGKKDTVLIRISPNIIDNINTMFDEIEQTRLKANTIKMEGILQKFPPLKKILVKFTRELTRFEDSVKQDVQTLIPDIRGGVRNSSGGALIVLLNRYAASPFNAEKADVFLESRRREIDTLKDIADPARFTGAHFEVMSYREASDNKMLYDKDRVLMLKFDILSSEKIVDSFLNGDKIDESHSWYNTPQTVATMGKMFHQFAKFSAANTYTDNTGYLFGISDSKTFPIKIFAQKEGNILTRNFTFPQLPEIMKPISITYNAITFHVKKTNSTWVENVSVNYRRRGGGESTTRTYQFSDDYITVVDVDDLIPNEMYTFSMRYNTVMGATPSGPEGIPISTKPCSAPVNLKVEEISSKDLRIVWEQPLHIGQGINLKYYVTLTGDEFIKTSTVGRNKSATFKQLASASAYRITVNAIVAEHAYNTTQEHTIQVESAATTLNMITKPDPPSSLYLLNVSLHSAEIEWTPPSKVAVGGVIEGYRLKYTIINNFGKEAMSGTELVRPLTNETFMRIHGLMQYTTYAVSVKVLTTLGDSDYSSKLIIKTAFEDTGLEIFKESLEKEVNKSAVDLKARIAVTSGKIESKLNGLSKMYSLMENFYYPNSSSFTRLSTCGGTIRSDGELMYPESGNYRNNEDCTWYIKTGIATTLVFTRFEIEYSNYCNKDYVEVSDNGASLGRHCSSFSPASRIYTKSGNVAVKFHSDGYTTARGFAMKISGRRIAAQGYYPQYRATFLGYGHPSSSSNETFSCYTAKANITACFERCHGKYRTDTSWNGVKIDVDDNQSQYSCFCYKNAYGHVHDRPSELHYRIGRSKVTDSRMETESETETETETKTGIHDTQ